MTEGAGAYPHSTEDQGVPGGLGRLVATARAAGDELRAGVLRVLKDESYSVLELCRILETGQPGLSHHLKILYQAGLVSKRREANTIFYRRAPVQTTLQGALLDAIDEASLPPEQSGRIEAVHAERSRRSEAFFTEHAADFASNQARISEVRVYAASVLDAVDRLRLGNGAALEIGPGNGELLVKLASRFQDVVGIDSAQGMLDRCAARADGLDNVHLMHRDVASMAGQSRFQLVLAAMVAHHQPSPQRFFRQTASLLRPDGVLIVVELCRHDHEWARAACGDLWLGFEPAELSEWAVNAGLTPGESQFLAQKNGFRIQIHTYHPSTR